MRVSNDNEFFFQSTKRQPNRHRINYFSTGTEKIHYSREKKREKNIIIKYIHTYSNYLSFIKRILYYLFTAMCISVKYI